MVAFANPVAGHIYAKGEAHPLGTFRVTATFADHIAGNRNPGIDIGNGKCGDPILAMDSGIVTLAGLIGTAKVVRIKHNNGYETAAAHLATIEVKLGQLVIRGQRIGTLGMTGATACHDHGGCKDPLGNEVDWWPLLIQNGAIEEGEDVLQGTNPVMVSNRRGNVLGDNTRFRSSPFVRADNVLTEYDAGAQLDPDYIVEGTSALGTNKWYGAWGNVGTGKAFGYVNVNAVSSLVPIEQSGHSDQELKDARSDGIADAAKNAAATV